MKLLYIAAALLIGAPAFAQTTSQATQAEIEAYTRLHNKAMSQLNSLIPVVQWPGNDDRDAYVAACTKARAGAEASLPRTQAILDGLQSAKPLATTGDADRDLSFQVTHTELINTIGYLQTALTQISSTCASAEQGHYEQAYTAAMVMVDAVLKIQESGSISIRSARGEPGPPAKKAAIEGLALSTDATGVMARFMFGKAESQETATKLAALASGIRIQVKLIREGYATNPASAGAALGQSVATARATFPDKLELAAALFEKASAHLLSGDYTEADSDAFFPAIKATGIGKGYNAAWALQ